MASRHYKYNDNTYNFAFMNVVDVIYDYQVSDWNFYFYFCQKRYNAALNIKLLYLLFSRHHLKFVKYIFTIQFWKAYSSSGLTVSSSHLGHPQSSHSSHNLHYTICHRHLFNTTHFILFLQIVFHKFFVKNC